jgi:hypothetical protein
MWLEFAAERKLGVLESVVDCKPAALEFVAADMEPGSS